MRELADEIETVLEENRKLAEGGLNDVRTVLDAEIGSSTADIYTDAGRRYRIQAEPMQLDQAL